MNLVSRQVVGARSILAHKHSAALCCLLFFSCAFPQEARAGFVGYYALNNFTLTLSTFATGDVQSPDGGASAVFTGPHDGSGFAGTADLTIRIPLAGIFRFDYLYSSNDDPTFDYAGYLLNGAFFQFADTDGQSGTLSLPVLAGDVAGFRIGSLDNQGEPGVLTISSFSAPSSSVPEPEVFWLTTLGVLTIAAARHRRKLAQFASRNRIRIVVAGLLAAAASGPLFAQQNNYFGSPVTGQLQLTTVVNARQASLLAPTLRATAQAKETLKPPPPRLRPPMGFNLAAQNSAPITGFALSLGGSPVPGFNAVSHLDQRLANQGNQFSIEPPSPSIAAGNGFILEGVNDAIQVFNESGAPLLGQTLATNQLFGLPPAIDRNSGINGPYLTDMRVFYDAGINRWFVLQRGQDNDSAGNPLNQSHLYMAVSKTGDPTGDYYIYTMDTTNSGHPGCPCFADYPQVGADQYGLHIAWNEFTTYSLQFVDAAIMTVSKTALAAGQASPAAYQFLIPYTNGYEFAIQPASTPPGAANFLASGGVEYFVSTLSRFAFSSSVALWAMRNTSSLATPTPNLVLSEVVVNTEAYTFPDVATQRPGPLPYGSTLIPPGMLALLDGGDCRVQALSYAGARLYITLPTGLGDANGRTVVGGAYIVLTPTFRNNALAGSVVNQGYLFINGNHLLRPAIAVNSQGKGAIAVTLVGPDWYPSAAVIPFDTFSTPSTMRFGAQGALPEDGFTGYPDGGGVGVARWGDYNTAVAASDGSIWIVAQYIANLPRTDFANWNTYVMRAIP